MEVVDRGYFDADQGLDGLMALASRGSCWASSKRQLIRDPISADWSQMDLACRMALVLLPVNGRMASLHVAGGRLPHSNPVTGDWLSW